MLSNTLVFYSLELELSLYLPHRATNQANHLKINPFYFFPRLLVALTQGLCHREDEFLDFLQRSTQANARTGNLRQLLTHAAQPVEKKAGIGRIMNVGSQDRRISTNFAAAN